MHDVTGGSCQQHARDDCLAIAELCSPIERLQVWLLENLVSAIVNFPRAHISLHHIDFLMYVCVCVYVSCVTPPIKTQW